MQVEIKKSEPRFVLKIYCLTFRNIFMILLMKNDLTNEDHITKFSFQKISRLNGPVRLLAFEQEKRWVDPGAFLVFTLFSPHVHS